MFPPERPAASILSIPSDQATNGLQDAARRIFRLRHYAFYWFEAGRSHILGGRDVGADIPSSAIDTNLAVVRSILAPANGAKDAQEEILRFGAAYPDGLQAVNAIRS